MKHLELFSTLSVTCHTKHVGPGSTFVAIKGMREDGIDYIWQAIDLGATTIVVEQSALLSYEFKQLIQQRAQLLQVPNARYALAELSAQAHGYPARQLTMIGVTGTKGKTTTAFLLAHMLQSAGYKTALLSTVKNQILGIDYATELTTQQPDYLHAFLRHCVNKGVTHVVMEVAAQALSLHRVATITFDAVLFLNFSQEHGEFYATMDDYFAAKSKIVDLIKPHGYLIVPENDARINSLEKKLVAQQSLHAFSIDNKLSSTLEGIHFSYQSQTYGCPALMGDCNVYNIRAAMACLHALQISEKTVSEALLSFDGVPGRLNKYYLPNGAIAFIDYAHNPASFQHIFQTMRPLTDNLVVIFGAGGDRDIMKRPAMGACAATYADTIILTTDNPRSEDPAKIVEDILQGIHQDQRAKVSIEMDREQAIRQAYRISRTQSIILLLGKGPDEYQLSHGLKTYFSERAILQSLALEGSARDDRFTKNSNALE